ncbi:hypothetical protein HK18_05925 [Commensalibacter intestini]|uniref:Lipoprotein n=1 Tax=Commensalibacter intestini TaxID=479936 RepID=A0A251ZW82_9PROT|nr:TRL-like family protein [Commensalibacter intestini]OUI78924.1 hypothetical protein HK18_05925 [Commensalibacter intestini]
MIKKVLPLFAVAALLAGCAIKGPVNATSNVASSKSGESCSNHLLMIFSWGDASIATAKTNGGITKVSAVDTARKGFLPIFYKSCTEVSGD